MHCPQPVPFLAAPFGHGVHSEKRERQAKYLSEFMNINRPFANFRLLKLDAFFHVVVVVASL
jgi:hypothetical protein